MTSSTSAEGALTLPRQRRDVLNLELISEEVRLREVRADEPDLQFIGPYHLADQQVRWAASLLQSCARVQSWRCRPP